MKFKLLIFVFVTFAVLAKAQSDSTHTLFRSPKYSYMQYDIGYSRINTGVQSLNGFDMSFLGAVFNDKWLISVGATGWVSHSRDNYLTQEPLRIENYVFVYLNNEYLIQPKKLINFSIGVKVGYGGIGGWNSLPPCTSQCIINWNFTGRDYYNHYSELGMIVPGGNIFINLFKPLSLGLGANYTYMIGNSGSLGNREELNSYNLLAFLRIKLDTKAMYKRQMERIKNLQNS